MRSLLLLIGVSLLLCSATAAQTVWNVSPPGSALLTAIANARDGDTIVAAPGVYNVGTGITTSKALTIIGQPGVLFYGSGGGPAIKVHSLPVSATFRMRGVDVELRGYNYSTAFVLENNAGSVHLSKCRFTVQCTDYSCAEYFLILNCALVTLAQCSTQSVSVDVMHSKVQASGCVFRGHLAREHPVSIGRAATAALWVQGSAAAMTMSRCSATGGSGAGKYSGAVAAVVRYGTLTIAGDANDAFTAGAPGATATGSVSAIYNDSGRVLVDPRVRLVPNAGQPPIYGPHAFSPRPIAVDTTTAAIGGNATTTVIGDAGEPVALFIGLPAAPTPLPPLGDVWVRAGSEVLVVVTWMPASERYDHMLAIPNRADLRSLAVTAQAVSGGVAAPLRLSLATTFVIE